MHRNVSFEVKKVLWKSSGMETEPGKRLWADVNEQTWRKTTAQTSPPCLHATSTIEQTRVVFRHRCKARATMVIGCHDRSSTLGVASALKCSTNQQNDETTAKYQEELAARTEWDTWARTCDTCVSYVTETQHDETELLPCCCRRA